MKPLELGTILIKRLFVLLPMKLKNYIFIAIILGLGSIAALAQPANPANWMYPEGNTECTRYLKYKSRAQEVDSFKIKWSTSAISGDIKPLIGNIINNPKIFPGFSYAPNEITAVQSGRIIVVDATGKTHKMTDFIPFLKEVSALIDTNKYDLSTGSTAPLVLGIETVEVEKDSLAFALIAGFNTNADTVMLLRRLGLDMRPYKPNHFAAVKPIYGKKANDEFFIYSTINTSVPTATPGSMTDAPYFRGLAQFRPGTMEPNYPLPDSKDVMENRVLLAGEVNFASPSFTQLPDGRIVMAMPYFPTPSLGDVRVQSRNLTTNTFANIPYLVSLDISDMFVKEEILPTTLSYAVNGTRPQIRPYYIHITDREQGEVTALLVSEEYRGRDGSVGTAKLHLYDTTGTPITDVFDTETPPFAGGVNHQWSVAVGNIDGNPSNNWGDYYPNNPGQEIIVTQSTRDFAVAASKLFVLRYYSGNRMEKPTPPGAELFPFDTICSQRINGWVAAVNDIDGAGDNKDEMFLVDGSILRIVKLRDYNTFEFKIGNPLDTLMSLEFHNQTISNVAIADLEGDGLNDIIVTTHDSTYVIGSEIFNTLKVLEPAQFAEYCAGDTMNIKWVNVIKSPTSIDILYQGFKNGVKIDSLILIHSEYNNIVDTSSFKYVVDKRLIGTTGHFIVRAPNAPDRVIDQSADIQFNEPWISINPPADFDFYPGKIVTLTGSTRCVDSVALEFSYNDSVWVRNLTEAIATDGSFRVTVELPCPDFFRCDTVDAGRFLYARGISFRADLSDTSITVPIPIHPAHFPVEIVPCSTGCPTRVFTWDMNELSDDCSNISIYISMDKGLSFIEIGNVAANVEKFSWNVPLNLPDEIIVRYCCANSCVRTDTILRDFLPSYINVIAPNPFNPNTERLEVTYNVPNEAYVTIKIIDVADRLVAEPVHSIKRTPGIAYCDYWDGIRHDGTYCENGLYYLVLELSTGAKQVYPVYIKK